MIKNYLIIKNKNNFKTLVYYPVAKNANSSVKLFLIKHLGIEKKFYFLDNEIPCFLQTKNICSVMHVAASKLCWTFQFP